MVRRILVVGVSGSGKSTVAARLAAGLDVPHVELDAINWLSGWAERDHDEFRDLVAEATAGDRWVVSGNYTSRGHPARERAEMVVWLDLPLRVTVPRQLIRSWRRWRSGELLWGTNVERFWPQLAVWDPRRSIVGFSVRARPRFRTMMLDAMSDPRCAHLRFVRLASQREVDRFVASILAVPRSEPA